MKTKLMLLAALVAASLFAQNPVIRQGGSTGTSYVSTSVANEGVTGTTVNKLAKLTGAPSTAIIAGTSDTSGIVGIVVGGAGTSGSAEIARVGQASCTFDATATTAGHYVQISSTVAGACHDAGATYPTSGQVIGFVTQTTAGSGTANVLLRPDIQAQSSGSSYNPNDTTVYQRVDEFESAYTTSGAIGSLGWSLVGSCTASAAGGAASASVNTPGLIRILSTASASAVCSLALNDNGPFYGLNAATFTEEQTAYINGNIASGGEIRVGFGAGTGTASPTTSAAVEAVKGTDTDWFISVYASGSLVGSRVDTGVAFSDTAHRITTKIRGDGTKWYVSIAVDGGSFSTEKSIGPSGADYTATLPTGALGPYFQVISSAGGTGSNYYVDRWSMNLTGLSH